MTSVYLVTTHHESAAFTGAKLRRQGFLNAKTAHKVTQITRMDASIKALICFACKLFKLQMLLLRSSNIVVVNEGLLPILNFKKNNKTFFLIHDLKNSTLFSRKFRRLRSLYYFLMVHIHDAILTVSNSEKARLETVFRHRKIAVNYNGVSQNFSISKKLRLPSCKKNIEVKKNMKLLKHLQ